MRVFNKNETLLEKDTLIRELKLGKIFIYPTDTIYGIGCDALNEDAIKKIRELKERYHQPFSVIVPSKQWIKDNCHISKKQLEWLKKLPGPYTFILKLKNKLAVSNYVNPGMETIGVRIPKHWFTKFIQETDMPIITTSVNKTGEEYMTSMEDIDPDIKKGVDYIFFDKTKIGKPSTLIDFTKGAPEVKKRK